VCEAESRGGKQHTAKLNNNVEGRHSRDKTCHPTGQDDELGSHRSAQKLPSSPAAVSPCEGQPGTLKTKRSNLVREE